MSKQGSDKKRTQAVKESPLDLPFLYAGLIFLLWLIMTNVLFVIADRIWVSFFTLMVGFGFIYPAGSLVLFFRLGRRHGTVWYFYPAVIAAVTAEYILVPHFSSIIPNMIVMTIVCLLFGCGIGGCFADKTAIQAAKDLRRAKKLHEDVPYESILSDKGNAKKKN